MFKSQYNEIKKYRKRRQGILTIKNMVLASVIVLFSTSIGYAYWNTTLKIQGTVTAIGDFGGGGNGGTWENPVEDTTTQEYDPDNVPEGTTVYTSVSGAPKVKKENGKVVRFEYTDTGNNGVTLPSGGLDTGVLAFDGNDFVITLKAKFNYSSANINPIIVLSKRIDSNVEGLVLFNSCYKQAYTNFSGTSVQSATNVDRFRMQQYNGGSLTNPHSLMYYTKTSESNRNTLGFVSSDSPVTVTIKMYNTNNKITAEVFNSSNTPIGKLCNYEYDFSTVQLDDITIELGRWENNAGKTYSYSFNILEFSVVKS